jgi:hypothetical protein
LATEFRNTKALDFSYTGRMLRKRTFAQHFDVERLFAWRTIWESFCDDPYQQLTGAASPVRGGQTPDRETDRAARLEVAEELGHSRESVTTHYLGR